VAIALTVVTLALVLPWRENYGQVDELEGCEAIAASVSKSCKVIVNDPVILYLGLSQACFEGAVYSFGKPSMHASYYFCSYTYIYTHKRAYRHTGIHTYMHACRRR
jgi:hypothetical protein